MKSNATKAKAPAKVRTMLSVFYALPVLCALGIFGYLAWAKATHQGPPSRHISGKPFVSVLVGKFTANLFSQGEQLQPTDDDLFIEFRDGKGDLMDVGKVTYSMALKTPDVIMHSIGNVMRTGTPGQYRTTVNPQIAGEWLVDLGYDGSQGKGETNFLATIQPVSLPRTNGVTAP